MFGSFSDRHRLKKKFARGSPYRLVSLWVDRQVSVVEAGEWSERSERSELCERSERSELQ